MTARGADRRPDAGAGRDRRAGVPPGPRRDRARPGAVGARRVVRGVGRREDRDGLRHREHGLDLARAARHHRVHPGRRRDQRRRDGHQRRRPAVLERRVDDAHAHQGHPGDDAGLRDGAHRQAVARLLRRRVGRGQLRHRRLRPDHGPERAGPVLGARPLRRGGRPAAPTTRTPTGCPASASRASRRRPTRSTATSATPRTPAASSPASGRSSTTRRTRSARSRSTSARCCAPSRTPTTRRWSAGWTCSTRRTSSSSTRTSAGSPVALLGIESKPLPRRGPTPVDGPKTFTAGTLFPKSSKKAARAINAASGNRPAGGAGEPVGLRRLAGVAARPAAGVRRGDRPRGGQLRRPDRVLRRLALPRRRLRGVLRDVERVDGGRRGRGLVRVGDRRCAGGGGRVRGRGEQARRRPTRAWRTWRPGSRRRPRRAPRARRPGWPRSWRRSGRGCARTSWARWRPSSTRRTASNARSAWARCTGSSRRRTCARTWSTRCAGDGPFTGTVGTRAHRHVRARVSAGSVPQAPLATRTRATARSFAAGSRRPSARAFSSPSSSDPTAAASWAPDDHSAWSAPAVRAFSTASGKREGARDGLHRAQVVGDDEAVEAVVVAQQPVGLRGERGRQAVGESGDVEMPDHHRDRSACPAARSYGRRSVARRSASGGVVTRPLCESPLAWPCPGKCLSTGRTPAARSPSAKAPA